MSKDAGNIASAHHDSDFEPTVIIAGAGTNDIGWEPITESIHELLNGFPEDVRNDIKSDDKFFFAFLSTCIRTLLKHRTKFGYRTETRETVDKGLDEYFQLRTLLTESIANKIVARTSNANVHIPSSQKFQLAQKSKETKVITLNWDELLTRHFSSDQIIQLHGKCTNAKSMLLPTESVIIDELFFERNEKTFLFSEHMKAIGAIQKAKTLILWGCSLDVYDAEIQMVMREAIGASHINRVLVIDTKKQPVSRLKFLINSPEVVVTYLTPQCT